MIIMVIIIRMIIKIIIRRIRRIMIRRIVVESWQQLFQTNEIHKSALSKVPLAQ